MIACYTLGMSTPSADDVLDEIEATIDRDWIDPETSFPMLRIANSIYMRSAGESDIIRITVERLPRDAWPELTET